MSATIVTGAFGCLGSWVTTLLAGAGEPVVAYDLGDDPRRLNLVAAGDALERVTVVQGDVTDLDALARVIGEHGVTSVIHVSPIPSPR